MMERLATIVETMRAPRVLIVGDVMVDRYIRGSVERISPEAPIQILKASSRDERLGGAANVAQNAAAIDGRVSCAGVVGDDPEGATASLLCRRKGINPLFVRERGRPTILKTRFVAHHQQMLRVDHEETLPIAPATERQLIERVKSAIRRGTDIIVISDYDKGAMTENVCRAIVEIARRRAIPLIVGLKAKSEKKYRGATAVSLNRAELATISEEHNVRRGAIKILRSLKLAFLIVTLGERGISVWFPDGRSVAMPAQAREIFDVTGAGDTVLAVFSAFYGRKTSIEDSLHLANVAAGIVVGKVGTATADRKELAAALLSTAHRDRTKIAPPSRLSKELKGERAQGNRVVFTNGCFDLLHAGHLHTLRFARSKGDILVVGLNSDRSVRLLKGQNRPILPQRERAELLAALELVDYVTIFDEETPEKLIRRIRPDVLIKGADWKRGGVVGREFVESYGGRVELVPLVEGRSTSSIVKRILAQAE